MSRVAVLVDWFHPGFKGGGPIRSCFHLVKALAEAHEVFVLTRDRDLGDEDPYTDIPVDQWVQRQGYRIMYLGGSNPSLSRIRSVLRELAPEHIYLNSVFSFPFSIWPLMMNRLGLMRGDQQITLAPRGMLLGSALAKKGIKKKMFFTLFRSIYQRDNVRFHATNEKEARSITDMFGRRRIFVAANLPDSDQKPLQVIGKIPGELRLLYLARIDPIKNLLLLLRILGTCSSEIRLTIAGPVEDQGYWAECQRTIADFAENIHVRVVGAVEPEQAKVLMKEAHVYVMLSRGENFGHSIFESFLCGRPVVISDQTPWRGLSQEGVGHDLPLDDEKAVHDALEEAAGWDQQAFGQRAASSWSFAKRYLENDASRKTYFEMFS